jgi:hypothetical protein
MEEGGGSAILVPTPLPSPTFPSFLFFSFARTLSENTGRTLIQRVFLTPSLTLLLFIYLWD